MNQCSSWILAPLGPVAVLEEDALPLLELPEDDEPCELSADASYFLALPLYSSVCVPAPATPSTVRPFTLWNDLTALTVIGP